MRQEDPMAGKRAAKVWLCTAGIVLVAGSVARGSADGYSKGEFHKVTAFHDISLFVHGE